MPPPNAARNARIRAVRARAKRALKVLICFINGQTISYSAYCINQLLLEGFINLTAQVTDINIHYIGLVEGFITPDVLGDLSPCQDASWFTQQAFQHRKLFQ